MKETRQGKDILIKHKKSYMARKRFGGELYLSKNFDFQNLNLRKVKTARIIKKRCPSEPSDHF